MKYKDKKKGGDRKDTKSQEITNPNPNPIKMITIITEMMHMREKLYHHNNKRINNTYHSNNSRNDRDYDNDNVIIVYAEE